jgi:competence protein ComEC
MKCNRWFRFTSLVLYVAALATIGSWSAAAPAATLDAAGKLIVTFVDVKEHGLSLLVQTPAGDAYLIDTGPKGKTHDAGKDVLGPLLKARGVRQLAGIVLTHSHADHYGGAPWLLENFPVKCLVDSGYEGRGQSDAYRAIRRQAQERGAQYVAVHAGDRLSWDKALEVEVLSPPKEFLNLDADPAKVSEHSVLNNNSLVLRIQHGKNVFLLPADAYGSEGSYLVKNWPADKLRANVLSAPHHGFNSTSGYAALIKPEVVVASCVAHYDNSPIASPGDQAMKIFGPVGAKVYSTAWNGSVEVTSDGRTLEVKTERSPLPAGKTSLRTITPRSGLRASHALDALRPTG